MSQTLPRLLEPSSTQGLMRSPSSTRSWEWPSIWFGRLFDYVEEKFALRRHGYPLYMSGGNRKVTYQPHVGRKENYHHPRCVMRNLLAVERLLNNGGRIDAPWSDRDDTG